MEAKVHPFPENRYPPAPTQHSVPHTLLSLQIHLGLLAKTAGSWLSWLSGVKSVLLWFQLVFMDFLMGDLLLPAS